MPQISHIGKVFWLNQFHPALAGALNTPTRLKLDDGKKHAPLQAA